MRQPHCKLDTNVDLMMSVMKLGLCNVKRESRGKQERKTRYTPDSNERADFGPKGDEMTMPSYNSSLRTPGRLQRCWKMVTRKSSPAETGCIATTSKVDQQ